MKWLFLEKRDQIWCENDPMTRKNMTGDTGGGMEEPQSVYGGRGNKPLLECVSSLVEQAEEMDNLRVSFWIPEHASKTISMPYNII